MIDLIEQGENIIESLKNENEHYRKIIIENRKLIKNIDKDSNFYLIKSFVIHCGFTFNKQFIVSRIRDKIAIKTALIQHFRDKKITLKRIGEYFGCDHSTILWHTRKHSKYDDRLKFYQEELIKFLEKK